MLIRHPAASQYSSILSKEILLLFFRSSAVGAQSGTQQEKKPKRPTGWRHSLKLADPSIGVERHSLFQLL